MKLCLDKFGWLSDSFFAHLSTSWPYAVNMKKPKETSNDRDLPAPGNGKQVFVTLHEQEFILLVRGVCKFYQAK